MLAMINASCTDYSISPENLWRLIGTAHAPRILDTCQDAIDVANGLRFATNERHNWTPAEDREEARTAW